MACNDWTDAGKGSAYRVVGDLIALRVQRVTARRFRVRVERVPADALHALRHPDSARVVMPWIEAQARSRAGAIAEAEAHGRRVIAAELAALDGGI